MSTYLTCCAFKLDIIQLEKTPCTPYSLLPTPYSLFPLLYEC
ncbi:MULTISPECIES: hypothetical protein [Moorena]|nr:MULTISPECIES: hypothetical protein [Moorena]